MLLFSRLRAIRKRGHAGSVEVPGAPPAGIHAQHIDGTDSPTSNTRPRVRFKSRLPRLGLRRKRQLEDGTRATLRRMPASIDLVTPPDGIGDPMESFSPVTKNSVDGAVRRDEVPDIIGSKIQGHHELWYRLAYGSRRDRRVSGGFALQPAMLSGKPLPRPKTAEATGLTHIASWRSRPKPWSSMATSPQGEGAHRHITSIDYGNADEVVLTNTQDACDVDILGSQNVLPEGAPKFMFHPYDKRKVVWDLIVAVLIVYGCISIPLRIGFDLGTGIGQIVVDAVVDVVFVLDMILSFRTAFVAPDGEMVTIPNEIAARYLKGSFMIDLCSTVPIDLLVLSAGGTRGILRSTKLLRTLRLLRLARLMKLSSIGGKEEDVEKLLHPSLWALIKMLVMLLFIAHIMGCMWHWLVVLRYDDITWVDKYGVSSTSWAHQYLVSVYWAFTTMTTVGYGDITSANDLERGFAIVGMIIGATVFGYIIGNVAVIMENFDVVDAIESGKMNQIKDWLYDRKFPPALAEKIRRQYKYIFKEADVFDNAEIVDILPGVLSTSLLYAQHRSVAKGVGFLARRPPVLVCRLLRRMVPCFANCGDVLYLEHEVGGHWYILRGGKVSFYVSLAPLETHSEVVLMRSLSDDGHFGLTPVLLNVLNSETATATSPVDLLTLRKDDLVEILHQWPEVMVELTVEAERLYLEVKKFRAAQLGLRRSRIRLPAVKPDQRLVTPTGAGSKVPGAVVAFLETPGLSPNISAPTSVSANAVDQGSIASSLQLGGRAEASGASGNLRRGSNGAGVSDRDVEDGSLRSIGARLDAPSCRAVSDTIDEETGNRIDIGVAGTLAQAAALAQLSIPGAAAATASVESIAAEAGAAAKSDVVCLETKCQDEEEDDEDGQKISSAHIVSGETADRGDRSTGYCTSRSLSGSKQSIRRASPSLSSTAAAIVGVQEGSGKGCKADRKGAGTAGATEAGEAVERLEEVRSLEDSGGVIFEKTGTPSERVCASGAPGSPEAVATGREVTLPLADSAVPAGTARADTRPSLETLRPPPIITAGGVPMTLEATASSSATGDAEAKSGDHLDGTECPENVRGCFIAKTFSPSDLGLGGYKRANYTGGSDKPSGLISRRQTAATVRGGGRGRGSTDRGDDTYRNTVAGEGSAFDRKVGMEEMFGFDETEAAWGGIAPERLFSVTGFLHPDSTTKVCWDLWVSIITVWSIVEVTFRLGFDRPASGVWVISSYVVDSLFLMDMMISLRTALLTRDGTVVAHQKEVAVAYFKGWFFVDLVSTVPWDLLVLKIAVGSPNAATSTKLIRALRLARLVRLIRLLKIPDFMEEWESSSPLGPSSVKLGRLLVIMAFSAHINACVWYAAGLHTSANRSWIGDYHCSDEDLSADCPNSKSSFSLYLVSVYFAFTTMTTTGYGDILPNGLSEEELAIAIASEVIGATIFAWVIGNLVNLVLNIDPAERNRKSMMNYLAEYMRDVPLSLKAKHSVAKNYAYHLQVHSVFNQPSIMGDLLPHLQNQAYVYLWRSMLPKLPFFCAMEDQVTGFVRVVLPLLKPATFSIGNVIVTPKIGTREMGFIINGEVEVRLARGRRDFRKMTLRERSHFGEMFMLLPEHVPFRGLAQVSAVTRVRMMQLTRSAFSMLEDRHPHVAGFMAKQLFEPNTTPSWVVVSKDFQCEVDRLEANTVVSDSMTLQTPRSPDGTFLEEFRPNQRRNEAVASPSIASPRRGYAKSPPSSPIGVSLPREPALRQTATTKTRRMASGRVQRQQGR